MRMSEYITDGEYAELLYKYGNDERYAGKTIEELLSIDAAADSELGPYCYNEEEEGRIQFLEDSFYEEYGPIEQE